jgi:hypothetical protein
LSWFALNVREDQLSQDRRALRVSRVNLTSALSLTDTQVILYAPSGEKHEGYFGVATISSVDPDFSNSNFIWLQLESMSLFEEAVPLDALYGSGLINDTPFHTYSRALRSVSEYEAGRLELLQLVRPYQDLSESQSHPETAGNDARWRLSKARIRSARLRIKLLEHYGPQCVFTDQCYSSLDGRRVSTQVGHLHPLNFLGPDIIQNALPMAPEVNWHWDNGIVSLTNFGEVLVSSHASAQTRSLFTAGKMIRFIDPKIWPRAEFLEWHRDILFEKDRRPGL